MQGENNEVEEDIVQMQSQLDELDRTVANLNRRFVEKEAWKKIKETLEE